MFDIVTFGSAVVDLFVDTDVAEKKGMISYKVGSKILLKNLRWDIGGGGTNTAVAFSRLGLKTGCICKIGDDEAGRGILDLFFREKVRFLGKIAVREMSGYSVVLDSKGGDRTILTYKGINNKIKQEDIKFRKIKTKWLYLTSLLGESFQSQIKLAEFLKKRGTKIVYNPSEYIIRKYGKKKLGRLVRLCDVIIMNKEEARLLAGKGDLLLGLRRLTADKGIVVITDKNKRIEAYDGNKRYYLMPHKVKVVERTGAGDAFASGFVASLVAGMGIEEGLKLGLMESESVIRYFGAKNNLLRMRLR
ncbi:MAG: carbohydrate kinase family protein [archaeon]